MAIDVCSDVSSAGISPRISFSHDLNSKEDAIRIEEKFRRADLCLLDSSTDFVFCINSGFAPQLSSADELFSNGKIVPTEVKNVLNAKNETHQKFGSVRSSSEPSTAGCTEKKRLKELLSSDFDAEGDGDYDDEKPSLKSFWQFKRSFSLNCDSTRPKSLIRSLQFLSRSNSTGSAPNPKKTDLPKETQKKRLQKQSSLSSRRSSTSSSSSAYYFYNPNSQKPSLNKNFGSCGNGVRISPVLNLPPTFFPKSSVSFSGFGFFFCNGKFKKKKSK